jgi:hypothetical protein
MCCFLTLFMLFGPRLAGVFWWLARPLRWVGAAGAFDTWIWPVLGLIFVPFTTLMYVAIAPGGIVGWDWLWMGLGVAADVASYAGGGYGNRQRIPGYGNTGKPPL